MFSLPSNLDVCSHISPSSITKYIHACKRTFGAHLPVRQGRKGDVGFLSHGGVRCRPVREVLLRSSATRSRRSQNAPATLWRHARSLLVQSPPHATVPVRFRVFVSAEAAGAFDQIVRVVLPSMFAVLPVVHRGREGNTDHPHQITIQLFDFVREIFFTLIVQSD
jgi:hypothetical protein